MSNQTRVIVVGAGPAGLTAARELATAGVPCTVLEADEQVGGISRTVERDGWRFDIGGHRFFTKVDRVREFWHDVLAPGEFLLRPRLSRIYYNGQFYDYPLRATNALRNLGLRESMLCVVSYLQVKVRPPRDQTTLEGWVAARFGWRLYRVFFQTYTEKVWGMPASQIGADWAAQRIQNLSLGRAALHALAPRRRSRTQVTSLIEQFWYPRLGPGAMWQACAEQASALGSTIVLGAPVSGIARCADGSLSVRCTDGRSWGGEHVLSSMPLGALVAALEPAPPPHVLEAAERLRHRDFLTVAVVVPECHGFPDNWLYIHAPEVRVGRVQNFRSWSPDLVKPGWSCLGLEYFEFEGGDLWCTPDDELVALAARELAQLGLAPEGCVEGGFVVRMPKAYPVYDSGYTEALDVLRCYLEENWPEIQTMGRNGMHRYNNQDHSMLTAMLAVENVVLGTQHELWKVNVDEEYLEESTTSRGGTGRDAPQLVRTDRPLAG